jgi:hypothetical protein
MNRTVSLVKLALGGLWSRLAGERRTPLCSEEQRIRFDRDYDAILGGMIKSSTEHLERSRAREFWTGDASRPLTTG